MKTLSSSISSDHSLELSVVVPCFNENPHIEGILAEWIEELREKSIPFEIIVINDGSLDGSGRVLDKMRKEHPELRIVHQLNMGSTRACRRGFEIARGRFVLIVSANGRCEPTDFNLFWSQRENHDLVIGRRTHRLDGFTSKRFTDFVKWTSRKLFGLPFQEPSLAYRLIRKPSATSFSSWIPIEWTSFHLALTVLLWKQAPDRVAEIKIPYRHRLERKSPFHRTGFISLSFTYLRESILLKFRLIKERIGYLPDLDSALRA